MKLFFARCAILGSAMLFAIDACDNFSLFETALWQWGRDPVEGVKGEGPFVDSSRILVRRHMSSGEKALLWTDGGFLSSIDRTLAEALCWELSPGLLHIGRDAGNCDAIIVGPSRSDGRTEVFLSGLGFHLVDELDGSQIWRRQMRDASLPSVGEFNESLRPSMAGDSLALAAFVSLFFFFAALLTRGYNRELPGSAVRGWCLAVFYAVLCSFHVLCSDLPANFGLGVYGGKARMWYLAEEGLFLGGFPSSAVLQPAYPPVFPCLIWLYNVFSGGCSERCVCMLPVLSMAAALAIISVRVRNLRVSFLLFALFACSPVLTSVASFGAESLMILFAVAGIAAVRDGKCAAGFFLIGLCGLVKIEGTIIAGALWIAFALERVGGTNVAESLRRLGIALSPGICWMAFAAANDAFPQDYAPLWSPDSNRLAGAFSEAFRTVVLAPWRYGFVYYIASGVVIARIARPKWFESRLALRIFASSIFIVLMSCAYVYILSLSRAPDFDWHCRCLFRVLAPPGIIAVALVVDRKEPV